MKVVNTLLWLVQQPVDLLVERGRRKDFEVLDYTIADVREMPLPSCHKGTESQVYYRIFISMGSCSEYEKEVGWVLNEQIRHCMICQRLLSQNWGLFETMTRHHCRACGNLICGMCSSEKGVVQGLCADNEEEEEVRVCRVCSWGQRPVACYSSKMLGKSLIHQDKVLSLTCPSKQLNSSSFIIPERLWRCEIHKKYQAKREFESLKALLPHLFVKKRYGSSLLLPVTSVTKIKIFYSLEEQKEISLIEKHLIKQRRKTKKQEKEEKDGQYSTSSDLSSRASSTLGPEIHEGFIQINLNVSLQIPLIAANDEHHSGDRVTMIPMVVNPVITDTEPLMIDIAINSKLLKPKLMKPLLEQMVLVTSVLFPQFLFTHTEAVKTSDANNMSVYMLIPPLAAVDQLHIVFTSITDLILDEVNEEELVKVAPTKAEEEFKQLIAQVKDIYSVNVRSLPDEILAPKEQREKLNHSKEVEEANDLPHFLLSHHLSDDPPFTVDPDSIDSTKSSDGSEDDEGGNHGSKSAAPVSSLAIRKTRPPLVRQSAISSSAWSHIAHSIGLNRTGVVASNLFTTVKSVAPPIILKSHHNKGQQLLTPHCLDLIKDHSIDSVANDHLKEEARHHPRILLGWQVIVMDVDLSSMKGLYVITGFKTTLFYGGLYRMSCFDESDEWIPLRLSESSHRGFPFTLFRKVLNLNEDQP